MEWNSFWPDLSVAFIAAIVGLVLAALIGYVSYRRDQRAKNRQLVANLADDLATRRAFTPTNPKLRKVGVDAYRCLQSVQQAQERLSQVRDQIRPDHELREILQEMILGCVTYKNAFEVAPREYVYDLMALRHELIVCLRSLEKHMRLSKKKLPDPGTAQAGSFRAWENRPSSLRRA
ncbi:hypothetical protein ITJ55_00180 [Frigoribacterium sp. VKM Ac-1396]|uniref:hypothetical protein n=1 Tax=unclassified Frigoribacterium TaxID=2627005 RepID=UPI00188AB0EB|nr:hypothetical protein [Frigoribacterium sp. VKM Ac-1396]MBF4599218.1 hypothetical protein [Frigoribacterium sp. VKM Ac-1396]